MCCATEPSVWRQLLVVSSCSLYAYGAGIIFAYPSSLNAAILSPNATDIKATVDQASWIASMYGLLGILGYCIFSPLLQVIGRKNVNIFYNLITVLGWTILYFSKSITWIFIGKGIQGFGIGGIFTCALTISELTHHKSRGVFLAIMKTMMACGSLFCHALAIIWDWRLIAAFSILPSLIALILTFFCPESPSFFAMKGRFKDCERVYTWLHGDSPESKNLLRQIISAQMERMNTKQRQNEFSKIRNFLKKYLKKDFLFPCLIVTFTTLAVDASGKYFLLGYVTQIMVQLIGDTNIAMYCAVVADVLLILASFISGFVIKSFKRRTVLLGFGSVTITVMFAVSLSTVVTDMSVIITKWATPILILLHSFISYVGLIPACFTIATEVFPLNLRAQGSLAAGINFSLFYAISMKVTPLLIIKTGIGGTYFIYGLCVTICLMILYFIVPETKDRTLQEIEDEMNNIIRTDSEIEIILTKPAVK